MSLIHSENLGSLFWWRNLLRDTGLEDVEFYGRIPLIWMLKILVVVMRRWVKLAQDRVQWRVGISGVLISDYATVVLIH
jgi:hypothetical protein